jgi:maltose-binding protein MalE
VIKLHRCGHVWLKTPKHPCWLVQSALDEGGVPYEIVPGPWPFRKNRTALKENTGQGAFPAIEFEDGSWYRDQARTMVRVIREGRLAEMHGVTPAR